MKYLYYPGCSLEGTAKEYHESTVSLMAALGAELEEIEDWSCCGASAANNVSELLSFVLPARNLALAEKMCQEKQEALDILVPCSACYLNLKKVAERAKIDFGFVQTINTVLEADGLEFGNHLEIRHLLDVLSRDVEPDWIAKKAMVSFEGFTAAPYYGCQCLRPYAEFDDPERPVSMERLISSTGAAVLDWNMGGVCCSASHMSTKPEVGLALVKRILSQAKSADMILTVCPMCEMNLEAYQKEAGLVSHESFSITILYLPQFLGMALGLPQAQTRVDLNLCVTPVFWEKYCGMTSRARNVRIPAPKAE
ncbi:MAG: disulfide reductase [Desulfobacteraceae bacterium]|nr:MAG: disulfide reductase [Desulfobacteraceae bacterium]